jgi:hypothetical protein
MNCASCKTDCHHILHSLFVDGLTRILVVGGLGVEDQQNGLRKVPILPRLINFCGVGQTMKPRAFAELEQQIRHLFLFLSVYKGKVLCMYFRL